MAKVVITMPINTRTEQLKKFLAHNFLLLKVLAQIFEHQINTKYNNILII